MSSSNTDYNFPEPGFGQFQVPEDVPYVQSYSKRGNAFSSDTTPVYMQNRWGNPSYVGGMEAYVSNAESTDFLKGMRQKRGMMGVQDETRWAPGYDWNSGYGIASLEANKNIRIQTRGGAERAGGPRRQNVVDRLGYWFETARPGVGVSNFVQTNDNYAGKFNTKRRTPVIMQESDMMDLKQMIEYNPFHINSHAAAQAKAIYDNE